MGKVNFIIQNRTWLWPVIYIGLGFASAATLIATAFLVVRTQAFFESRGTSDFALKASSALLFIPAASSILAILEAVNVMEAIDGTSWIVLLPISAVVTLITAWVVAPRVMNPGKIRTVILD